MSAPTIYLLDDRTGGLIGSRTARALPRRAGLADDNPKKWQMPANATLMPPPAVGSGEAACFVDGAWTTLPDHRGETVYAAADGTPTVVTALGALPPDVTTVPPPGPAHVFEDGAWVEDAAAARRLVPKREIIERLEAADLLAAARTALDAAPLYDRERWNARDAIYADDATALALLAAIGADPGVILAP